MNNNVARPSKPDCECERAKKALTLTGKKILTLTSRKPPYPDVLAEMSNGEKLAIEVTEVYLDVTGDGDGRENGSKRRRMGNEYANGESVNWPDSKKLDFHYRPLDSIPAIREAIANKVKKIYEHPYDEQLILLLVASNATLEAIVATDVSVPFIDTSKLNEATHELLHESKFTSAYLYAEARNVLWEWSPNTRWKLIAAPISEPIVPLQEMLKSHEPFLKRAPGLNKSHF